MEGLIGEEGIEGIGVEVLTEPGEEFIMFGMVGAGEGCPRGFITSLTTAKIRWAVP